MKKITLVIAGLSLAGSLSAIAQEQEDQEFNPNRDDVTEPRVSTDESRPVAPVDPEYGSESTAAATTQGTTSSQGSTAASMDEGGLAEMSADELAGMTVVTLTGEEIGEIGDVGDSPDGRIATVEVGGFLGVGEKTIGIPLSEMQKSVADEGSVRTSLTRFVIESHSELDDSSFTPEQ